jgi:uncharacterized cupredoxin-like copper-binding protein
VIRRSLALLTLVALVACGSGDGDAPPAAGDEDRTIEIEMRDIAFAPTAVDVRPGEKVRFVFTNTGQVTHDAFLGDAAAQERHEREMREGHGGHGQGAAAVTLAPGKKGQLTYTFDRPGQLLIGCHQPGHWTGGMKAAITVA